MINKNVLNHDIKNFNIPSKIKNYKIEKELFVISNGYMCLGINLNIKEKVIIKIYDKENFQNNSDEILLINKEIYILRIINHRHCLKLYEIIESPSFIFLIMEYTSGIKLIDVINRKKKFTEDESLNIYKQILSILIYFHEMNIGHMNINPDDILIDINNNIKIFDFKYNVFYKNNEKIKLDQIGDKNYLCPEIWSTKTCFPELADIWSSGVLLYFLIVGQLPFIGINDYDLQKKIMGAEFPLPLNISKNFQEFFKNIFEPKIESRYNLEKILDSPLFKDKKITKNNLPKGFNVLSTKYPIDDRVINICKTNFDIEQENLKQKLSKNIFDSQTSLYKQIISIFIKKKISSEIDLTSKKYITYITNENNLLDENIQKNNAQENLNKYNEIKKKYPETKINIAKNQNKILTKLNQLIEKYKIPKKDEMVQIEDENNKIEKKKINSENISKNKNDFGVKRKNKDNNVNKKRSSVYYIQFNSKPKKLSSTNLNINPGQKRRMSSALNNNYKFHYSLDKNISNVAKKSSRKNQQSSKYLLYNQKNIIKESNEEEKKHSNDSSRSSSLSRISSKKIIENKKDNKKQNNSTKKVDTKDIKINSVSSKKEGESPGKNKNIMDKTLQISKQDFFSQINGVKLKKNIPNTYVNQDENKKKLDGENKNQNSIECNNDVSMKGTQIITEDNINNSKIEKNNLSEQNKINMNQQNIQSTSSKISNIRENKSNKNEKQKNPKKDIFHKQRKSVNYINTFHFKRKSLIINTNEIKAEKSKDDTNKLKNRKQKKDDIIIGEQLNEIIIPKNSETNKKIKIGKNNKKEEKEEKNKEEKKKNKNAELKLKQNEEEQIRLGLEAEKRKRKENEEEPQRTKIELEKQERKKKEKDEEEQKKLLEEELKKKNREEIERKRKEEEKRKKEEEERIIREKEKLRLEEEEKIKNRKKEKQGKIEFEKKEKKAEKERLKKIKEEIGGGKGKEKEENKKRLEEYQNMIKKEEEKRILKETIKKKKEEEIKQKREKELINKEVKSNTQEKNIFNSNKSRKHETLKYESESSGEEEIIKNKSIKESINKINNSLTEIKGGNKTKNVLNIFNDFFFSDKKIINKNNNSRILKNKEKNEHLDGQKIFYNNKSNQELEKKNNYNRSFERLRDKVIYAQNFGFYNNENNKINEDYFIRSRNTPKNYKKLKIKINKENKRNNRLYANNIIPIKVKSIISKTNSLPNEIELMTETNNNNKIKANNVFKKIGIAKKLFSFKKKQKRNQSPNIIDDYSQELLRYSNICGINYPSMPKISTNKSNKKEKMERRKTTNSRINGHNSNSNLVSSNSSIIYNNSAKRYNKTDKAKSKTAKKIKNAYNELGYEINNINYSNKTNKTIIKIRRNSQKKRNNIKEKELNLYKGNIDYNNVSIKNLKDTISILIKRYKEKGYTYIKKEKAKYKFVKGDEIDIVEIMKLGNGLFYYNYLN